MPDQAVATKDQNLPFHTGDKPPEPENILVVIGNLAANPNMNPDHVSKWLEMYERLAAVEREVIKQVEEVRRSRK